MRAGGALRPSRPLAGGRVAAIIVLLHRLDEQHQAARDVPDVHQDSTERPALTMNQVGQHAAHARTVLALEQLDPAR